MLGFAAMTSMGLALVLAAAAAPAEGRPLFYWGARAPVVIADERASLPPSEARVLEK